LKAFIAILTLAMVATAHAQSFDKAKLDQLLERLAEKNKGMGSLTLAKDGKVIYSRSFGYAQIDENEKKPVTAATRFRIASITKTFTAVMILQLVEEGKLSLTDTLDKFFPQIPNAARITIGQILLHRSGMPDIQPDGAWGKQYHSQDEVVARIAQGRPFFEPDAKSLYSSAGYHLLGYIVEKAGGKPYRQALQERITAKAGLADTYLGEGNTNPARGEALAYMYFGDKWMEATEPHFSVVAGAGGIVSTATDLAKFIQAVFDLKLVSADSLKLMTTIKDGEGMGMVTFSFAGKTLYGNTGGSASTGAWLNYFPEEKLALAYTTNAKPYPVRDIVAGVFDIYWNRPYQIPAFDVFEVSTEILDRYVGAYSVPGAGNKANVTRKGAKLFFQPGSEATGVALEATAENKFKTGPILVFEFDAEKGEMIVDRGGRKIVFKKQQE
jgi:CubicO group peptidase (beta-lactamase class C family)